MFKVLSNNPATMISSHANFTREDHMFKERSLLRGQPRTPKRSQTHDNYGIPRPLESFTTQLRVIESTPPSSPPATPAADTEQTVSKAPLARRRPALGPRMRSYSLTDKEPAPRPSSGVALLDLPGELHFVIFDNLDLIDSVCLGLTNKHFYSIHRRLHGTVPLSTRRRGPNELEWAFHLAGNKIQAAPSAGLYHAEKPSSEKEKNALSKLRVRGQGYCRNCGITRCSLHKHIQTWMGEEAEYCSVSGKFGRAAPEGAKSYCYLRKPGDRSQCGRHWVRKSKVVLQ